MIDTITKDNRKVLDKFTTFLSIEKYEEFKLSDIFEKYQDYCANYVSTDDLDINYDDEVSYENITVRMDIDEHYTSSTIDLICESDEDLNYTFRVRSGKLYADIDIHNIALADKFDILLMQLNNNNCKIDLDIHNIEHFEVEVEVESEPEASFS